VGRVIERLAGEVRDLVGAKISGRAAVVISKPALSASNSRRMTALFCSIDMGFPPYKQLQIADSGMSETESDRPRVNPIPTFCGPWADAQLDYLQAQHVEGEGKDALDQVAVLVEQVG
jgi:hypothetical protein